MKKRDFCLAIFLSLIGLGCNSVKEMNSDEFIFYSNPDYENSMGKVPYMRLIYYLGSENGFHYFDVDGKFIKLREYEMKIEKIFPYSLSQKREFNTKENLKNSKDEVDYILKIATPENNEL